MPSEKNSRQWWGAPRKFDEDYGERRVSWLELFYDLVYVIAIARVTHHLAAHISVDAFMEYAFLFVMIFWGWLNGSLYHDIHGNEGLRTRLLTLWQMMIIAAFAITIDQPEGVRYVNMTIVLMIMQLFITYIWWAVGFYDKSHRYYNRPYTIFYVISFVLMGVTLFVEPTWFKWILPLIVICNYVPPFISYVLMSRTTTTLDLSESMAERLGLFTIIVFGELVLGVVNGISAIEELHISAWVNFALAIAIVFSLWWLFFTLTSNQEVLSGFLNATILELLYIPSLIALGLIGVSFSSLFDSHHDPHEMETLFGYSISGFLGCLSLMMAFLKFPERLRSLKTPIWVSLMATALIFLLSAIFHIGLETMYYLIAVLVILGAEIGFLNSLYYRLVSKEGEPAS